MNELYTTWQPHHTGVNLVVNQVYARYIIVGMNYYLEIPILYVYSNVLFIWVLTSSIPVVSQAALKLNISRIDLYFIKKIAVETWLDLITEAISTLRHPQKNITLKGVWKKITHLRKLALMSSSKDQ